METIDYARHFPNHCSTGSIGIGSGSRDGSGEPELKRVQLNLGYFCPKHECVASIFKSFSDVVCLIYYLHFFAVNIIIYRTIGCTHFQILYYDII